MMRWERTLITNAHRRMPAIMTKTPPPKIRISDSLRLISRFARHSMGSGMDIRYASVRTLRTTVT